MGTYLYIDQYFITLHCFRVLFIQLCDEEIMKFKNSLTPTCACHYPSLTAQLR